MGIVMAQSPRSSNSTPFADEQPDLPDAHPDPNSDAPGDEARMRKALGLLSGDNPGRGSKTQLQARPQAQMRAQGGRSGGPVVVEHATLTKPDRPGAAVNRLATVEAQLLAEKQARARAERDLRDAQLALQDARTKQAHAEMARQDAEARLSQARAEMDTLQASLQASALALAPAAGPAPAATQAAMAAATPNAPRKRGRPPKIRPMPVVAEPVVEVSETEPVEWWLPGWQKKV